MCGKDEQLTLSLSTGFDSNSQNLTSLSALPLTSACPSARTWMDHTVAVWAFTVSMRVEEATSYMRISPDLVPTATYGCQFSKSLPQNVFSAPGDPQEGMYCRRHVRTP